MTAKLPPNPEDRKPILMPAYYPGADTIESATGLILAPGEKREFIDISMRTAPSRCLGGRFDRTSAVRFEIQEAQPVIWRDVSPRFPASEGGVNGLRVVASMPPRGNLAASEGGIRICDLHSGDYVLRAYSTGSASGDLGKESTPASRDIVNEPVTIAERDVSAIIVSPRLPPSLDVDVVWDGKPPENSGSVRLAVEITSLAAELWDATFSSATVPNHFSMPARNDDYFVAVRGIPDGAYLKDVSYRGRSCLNGIIHPDAATAGGLQVILARDAARIAISSG